MTKSTIPKRKPAHATTGQRKNPNKNNRTNMYENLLRLPYFQGMSKKELTAILDKVKLEFSRHQDGEKIIRQEDKCDKFVILIQGKLSAKHQTSNNPYTLSEEIEAPYAIEPYSLFGSETHYSRCYTSLGDSSLLSIDKSYFYSDLLRHSIFTMNFLNLISRRAQIQESLSWLDAPSELEGQIARFVAVRSETLSGNKRLKIKMEQLAQQLGATRLNISRALNKLQEEGLATLNRGEIHFHRFEELIEKTWEFPTKKQHQQQ